MKRLITALDVAQRDGQPSVREWIRYTSIQKKMEGYTPVTFNGSVDGEPVYAFVSNGRWLAFCTEPGCDGCEYVDPGEPIFFCMKCSNGEKGSARQVKFPIRRQELEAALLEIRMMPAVGGELVNRVFNSRPEDPALRRDWIPIELQDDPRLKGRVLVTVYGETPEMIRIRKKEREHAGNI
jgi:hypothetical protein